MAKEVFQRTKPHVSIALLLPAVQAAREAARRSSEPQQSSLQLETSLRQLGLTPSGAAAFARGDIVNNAEDRQRLALIFQLAFA